MRRCKSCNQFFRVTECTCPFCAKSACENKGSLKNLLLTAAAATAVAGPGCICRPLYGIVIFDGGEAGGGFEAGGGSETGGSFETGGGTAAGGGSATGGGSQDADSGIDAGDDDGGTDGGP